MKRRRVYTHRTLKMREDFLQWLRDKNALQEQEAEVQLDLMKRAGLLAMMVWADDGGRVL